MFIIIIIIIIAAADIFSTITYINNKSKPKKNNRIKQAT